MDSNHKPQAKNFFLQIGIIVALYTSAISFLTFAFSIINYVFPDRQAYYFDSYYSSGIRFAISTLIVAFPILIWLSRMMYKTLVADPALRDWVVRRWISYFTLFVAGVVIAGDLITLINTFLGGEISERFVWKTILVLLVAGGVFWYTIRDLKGVYFEKPALLKLFTVITSVIVLGSIIWGLTIVGMPQDQRKMRDDQNREGDLSNIQWQIVSHYQRTSKLPADLKALEDPLYPNTTDDQFTDPETGTPYEYKILEGKIPTFELCANFALETRKDLKGAGAYPTKGGVSYPSSVDYYPENGGSAFEHTAGRNCFTRTIDPIKYPVQRTVTPLPIY